MPIPTRHVFATYLKVDDTPCEGYVEFTLVTEVVIEDVAIIPISTVTAVLDENGRIDADLLVSDDPLVQPEGLFWFVEEKIENGNTWYLQILTADGSPIDLGDLYVPGLVPPYIPIQGPPGRPGPPGLPGAALTYVHNQTALSNVWTVEHELNKHPVVSVEDAAGSMVYGTVHYVDSNILTVTFVNALTGKVSCV